jgi:tetratricopeptide (TPR) repeat protein
MKKALIFILTSLVIGNVISWFTGAWPITFERQPYNAGEKMTLQSLETELGENPNETDLLVELGSIYSLHNDIDIAARHLDKAILLAPEDPLALVWHSANAAKRSGASLDLTMGIYKLYTLADALGKITQAVELAPDDLTVRLVRLATFANTGTINSGFDKVFEDEAWFEQLLAKYPDDVPVQIKGQFYLSMAQAYFFKADQSAGAKVDHYLKLFKTIPDKAPADKRQFETLLAGFAETDGGRAWK